MACSALLCSAVSDYAAICVFGFASQRVRRSVVSNACRRSPRCDHPLPRVFASAAIANAPSPSPPALRSSHLWHCLCDRFESTLSCRTALARAPAARRGTCGSLQALCILRQLLLHMSEVSSQWLHSVVGLFHSILHTTARCISAALLRSVYCCACADSVDRSIAAVGFTRLGLAWLGLAGAGLAQQQRRVLECRRAAAARADPAAAAERRLGPSPPHRDRLPDDVVPLTSLRSARTRAAACSRPHAHGSA